MQYHIFNIGSKPNNSRWLRWRTQEIISAGFDGEIGDRGHTILHQIQKDDWVIVYANSYGYIGAGISSLQ